MEKRVAKINISSAGGTATKGSKTYKITIPNSWIAKLGLDENREVELTLDDGRVIISKILSIDEFKKKKHDLKTYLFYDEKELCSRIVADFTDHTVCVENYTTNLIKTAFGKNTLPTWDDFMFFLEERCVPRNRDRIREYLESLGLDEYDPIEIIKKTHGKMAEDKQWIKIEK